MSSFATDLTLVAAAVVWPLAAGVSVVVWSKARAAARRRRLAGIEGDLRGLFEALETRPVPPRLDLVIDALQEQSEFLPAPARVRRRRAAKAPTP